MSTPSWSDQECRLAGVLAPFFVLIDELIVWRSMVGNDALRLK